MNARPSVPKGTMDAWDLPLDGIRVVDLTQAMVGPVASQMLGDFGADVIKIERPGAGDLSRWQVDTDPNRQNNAVFCSLNRNKRSIALDLRQATGQAVVYDLVRRSDVVVSNFRAGVMERLNLDYERLAAINPGIVYACGSGFGPSGPYAHKGGQDVLAQALSGVMARTPDPDQPLSIYATTICDYTAGMHLVQGILAALLGRQRTGRGQKVEVSLYDSMLAVQTQEAAEWLIEGTELNWGAMPLSAVLETADGHIAIVGAFKQNPLRDISSALGIEDLSQDPRFESLEQQKVHRNELRALLQEVLRTQSTAHWTARLEEQDILCAPVKTVAEALEDPQTRHNEMVAETEHPTLGRIWLVASPVHLSAAPFQIRHPPPRLGEHTETVLAELGYEQARIDALRADGVLG